MDECFENRSSGGLPEKVRERFHTTVPAKRWDCQLHNSKWDRSSTLLVLEVVLVIPLDLRLLPNISLALPWDQRNGSHETNRPP